MRFEKLEEKIKQVSELELKLEDLEKQLAQVRVLLSNSTSPSRAERAPKEIDLRNLTNA